MPDYELVVVLAPTLDDEAAQAQIETITKHIEQLAGQVVKSDIWGRRTLAYPIKKFHEGQYVLFNIQTPASAVAELERSLKLSEQVIRHLVVRANE